MANKAAEGTRQKAERGVIKNGAAEFACLRASEGARQSGKIIRGRRRR
jgi:hypothetical protein